MAFLRRKYTYDVYARNAKGGQVAVSLGVKATGPNAAIKKVGNRLRKRNMEETLELLDASGWAVQR